MHNIGDFGAPGAGFEEFRREITVIGAGECLAARTMVVAGAADGAAIEMPFFGAEAKVFVTAGGEGRV